MTINAWAVEILLDDGYRFKTIERSKADAQSKMQEFDNATRVVPIEDFDWEDFNAPFFPNTN